MLTRSSLRALNILEGGHIDAAQAFILVSIFVLAILYQGWACPALWFWVGCLLSSSAYRMTGANRVIQVPA